ncbi:unnamed protein product [Parascedosporium putredinis]|uniref:DUF6536 domain-containing protein n=1 Tax=Parascedosporium putredinis TaxID=1442378 RepID=A0A9P1H1S2_9PEZI|nr:unnamed protein product [Parascedosporium putredinis]CAI7995412.1 unnamed protein product [Parascedosporium putredinis]
MEVIIPPRDHKTITYRYTWDEKGEVQKVERVRESVDYTSNRQTLQWPFQSTTSAGDQSTTSQDYIAHRATWQARPAYSGRSSPSTIDRDIVPDYVVNYLRGETPDRGPESLHARAGPLRPAPTVMVRRAPLQRAGGQDEGQQAQLEQLGGVEVRARPVISLCLIALLAISNYAFQVLSSPTRAEVSAAHDRRRWLDIGIPSFKNLVRISRVRAILAVFILLVAFTLQVLYNSVITVSRVGANASLIFVTEDFLSGAPFSNGTDTNSAQLSRIDLLALQSSADRGLMTNLTASQCVASFTGPFIDDFSTIIVVTSLDDNPSGSLVQTAVAGTRGGRFKEGDLRDGVRLRSSDVLFCLGETTGFDNDFCELRLSGALLGVAALVNLALVIAVAAAALMRKFAPLATLGDAISSFIEAPDATTRNACLLTKSDVRLGRWPLYEAKYWAPREHFWIMTPSMLRWAAFALSWLVPTALTVWALGWNIAGQPGRGLSPLAARRLTKYLSCPPAPPGRHTYYLGHEMSEFAVPDRHRALRRSWGARGIQQASLYLTLPGPGPGPSCCSSPAPHPLSVETVQITALSTSSTALLVLLALLIAILTIPIGLGLRRANPTASYVNGHPAGNPLAMRGGSCSAVISARCHCPENEVDFADPTAERLTWGVIREGEGMEVGRMGFAGESKGPRSVGMISVGRAYA